VSADGAYQERVRFTTQHASGWGWTIPSGEAWLFDAIYAEVFTNALKASFQTTVTFLDEDQNTISADTAAATNLPAGNWSCYHSRGGSSPVFTPAGFVATVGTISHIVALPGQEVEILFRPFGGGDSLAGSTAWAWVTKMDFGAGGPTGAVPAVEPIGPFLMVPGPAESVAA